MELKKSRIYQAIDALKADKIIAIPTETVYGLAGNIYSKKAIQSIFELKKRPFNNPLIVHIKSAKELDKIAREIPEKAQLLADAFWPGPLTLVLKKQDTISNLITSGKDTVAVRVPNHPLTLFLLELLDFPLAAPSANPFGAISPTNASHVAGYFQDILPIILDGGPCINGVESTIIGFENGDAVLYRLGATPVEAIELVVGKLKKTINDDIAPSAPGMFTKHYAPKKATYLTQDVLDKIDDFSEQQIGVLAFNESFIHKRIAKQIVISPNKDLGEAASNLYDALHQLDASNVDVIIAQKMPDEGLGKTINDRLERATKK